MAEVRVVLINNSRTHFSGSGTHTATFCPISHPVVFELKFSSVDPIYQIFREWDLHAGVTIHTRLLLFVQ